MTPKDADVACHDGEASLRDLERKAVQEAVKELLSLAMVTGGHASYFRDCSGGMVRSGEQRWQP